MFLLRFAATTGGASPPRNRPVAATIDTTLTTRGEQIRQLAFDGDEASFFASEEPPGADDHFTLVLDEPVRLRSIAAITGRADGGDAVRAGTLAVSADGTTFRELARFAGGTARGGPAGGTVRAIRIKPGPAGGPIAIRELTIDSDPPVGTFHYPVEFVVDTAEAPDLKPWAESTARACERAYPMINDELGSDGYRLPRLITLTLTTSYTAVAKMSSTHIVSSVDHFRGHRKDVGAIVHETTHVAQGYYGGNQDRHTGHRRSVRVDRPRRGRRSQPGVAEGAPRVDSGSPRSLPSLLVPTPMGSHPGSHRTRWDPGPRRGSAARRPPGVRRANPGCVVRPLRGRCGGDGVSSVRTRFVPGVRLRRPRAVLYDAFGVERRADASRPETRVAPDP